MIDIRTSHVGSFPLNYTHENIERVLLDLYNIGIDVPPYPQLRSFIDIYLKPLETAGHLYNRNGYYYLVKDSVDNIPKTNVVVYEAEDTINTIKKYNLLFKWIRAPITGVFTLASRIYVTDSDSKSLASTCLSNKELTLGIFKEFVKNIVKYMIELGFNVVFIDEPVFNYIIGRKKILFDYRDEEIIDVIDSVAKVHSGIEFGVHICGKINTKIIDIILQAQRIRYINIELHDSPSNIDLVSKESLEKYDKFIAPGVVSAQKPYVESVDDVFNIMRTIYTKVGDRIDLVSGDCGFGGFKGMLGDQEKEYSIALNKLRVVVEGVKKFKNLSSSK